MEQTKHVVIVAVQAVIVPGEVDAKEVAVDVEK
jgi:hypothetical protein